MEYHSLYMCGQSGATVSLDRINRAQIYTLDTSTQSVLQYSAGRDLGSVIYAHSGNAGLADEYRVDNWTSCVTDTDWMDSPGV